jgi:rifampin ADP-ribosylating transferase
MKNSDMVDNPDTGRPTPFTQTYFHGTRAALEPGSLIEVGLISNYGQRNKAKYIYLTATLDAAIWGAELAVGKGRERIYLVEATGPVEDDPNLTDQKFPGNPSMSYRSMKEGLDKLRDQGIEAIED